MENEDAVTGRRLEDDRLKLKVMKLRFLKLGISL